MQYHGCITGYYILQLERDDELVKGLDNITGVTEEIQSLEVSISTALIEKLVNGGNTIGNQSVSALYVARSCNDIIGPYLQLSDPFLNVIDNLLAVPVDELIDSNNEVKSSARWSLPVVDYHNTAVIIIPITYQVARVIW